MHRSYEREIDEIQMAEELFTVGAAHRSIGSVRTGGRDHNAYNPHDTWLLWRGREREMKLVSINGAFTLRFHPLIEK